MNLSDLSRSAFSAAPVLVSEATTAHSGPELISSLPNPTAGLELASALMSEHVKVNHVTSPVAAGVPTIPSIFISLSRR